MASKTRVLLPLLPAALLLLLSGLAFFRPEAPLPFTAKILEKERKQQQQTVRDIQNLAGQNRKLSEELHPLQQLRATALTGPTDQAPVRFRERLEQSVAAADIKVRAMRDVQSSALTETLTSCELSFSADCTPETLGKLLEDFSGKEPRLYWKTLKLRPDNTIHPKFIVLDAIVTMLNFQTQEEE